MMQAKGDWALFTDADLSSPIEDGQAVERGGTEKRGRSNRIARA